MLLATILNLNALEFGKDISIIGSWNIKSENMIAFNFIDTVGNEWWFKFNENNEIYDLNPRNDFKIYGKRNFKWNYEKNGEISIKYNNEITGIFINLNTSIKVIKQIQSKNLEKCYIIKINENKAQMCEILDKIEKERRRIARAKEIIKIEIK